MLAGVGLAESMLDMGVPAALKWPNDVLVNGKKVAGCLAKAVPEQGFIILGVGVNVHWPEQVELPDELVDRAEQVIGYVSADLTPEDIAARLLASVIRAYAETDEMAIPVKRMNRLLDKETVFKFKELYGKQVEVFDDGALKVSTDSGESILGVEYAAGD
jgi:biotin-(acetyl-CoA carboxylase) ligase